MFYIIKTQYDTMLITVKRIYTCSTYTISKVYADGQYVCDALEDADRMLDDSMSEAEILKRKVKGKTAIPTGKYRVLMDVISYKYSNSSYFKRICGCKLPRLYNVKGFSGILIHTGNTAEDTEGCLLVGYNKEKGKVLDSKKAFEKLYPMLKISHDIGQPIWIEYKRTY